MQPVIQLIEEVNYRAQWIILRTFSTSCGKKKKKNPKPFRSLFQTCTYSRCWKWIIRRHIFTELTLYLYRPNHQIITIKSSSLHTFYYVRKMVSKTCILRPQTCWYSLRRIQTQPVWKKIKNKKFSLPFHSCAHFLQLPPLPTQAHTPTQETHTATTTTDTFSMTLYVF